MAPKWSTSPQKFLPAAADGLRVSCPRHFVWGAWQELGLIATESVLTSVSIAGFGFDPGYIFTERAHVQIAVGVASASTTVADLPLMGSGWNSADQLVVFPEPLDVLPAGIKVFARIWAYERLDGSYFTVGPCVSVGYMEKPLVGTMVTTANTIVAFPDTQPVLLATPASTNWQSGWAEVIPSAAQDYDIAGITYQCQQTRMELDIGVGGLGSEVVVQTVAMTGAATQAAWGPLMFSHRMAGLIPLGSRVSFRVRLAKSVTKPGTVGSGMFLGYLLLYKD